jgi:hypothetical protein
LALGVSRGRTPWYLIRVATGNQLLQPPLEKQATLSGPAGIKALFVTGQVLNQDEANRSIQLHAGSYALRAEGREGLWWTSQVTLLTDEHLTPATLPSSLKNPCRLTHPLRRLENCSKRPQAKGEITF